MEYLLHLTKLYPDMMYIHQDSGLINVAYFKFNIDDAKGKKFWMLVCEPEGWYWTFLHAEVKNG